MRHSRDIAHMTQYNQWTVHNLPTHRKLYFVNVKRFFKNSAQFSLVGIETRVNWFTVLILSMDRNNILRLCSELKVCRLSHKRNILMYLFYNTTVIEIVLFIFILPWYILIILFTEQNIFLLNSQYFYLYQLGELLYRILN